MCFSFNSSGSVIFLEAFCRGVSFPDGLEDHDTIGNIALYISSRTHFTTLKLLHTHLYRFSVHMRFPSVLPESNLSPYPPPTDARTGMVVSHTETAAIHLCHPYPHTASFRCLLLVTMKRHTHVPAPANICRDTQMSQQTHFSGCAMASKESRQAQMTHVLRTPTQPDHSCFDPLLATIQH